jgi:hypothetical protein
LRFLINFIGDNTQDTFGGYKQLGDKKREEGREREMDLNFFNSGCNPI